ncbi:regulatory protein RecX [Arthrobacter sp. KBS0702]|nr:regulatory protein RecX [Arthrobacter sp. KBS0702]
MTASNSRASATRRRKGSGFPSRNPGPGVVDGPGDHGPFAPAAPPVPERDADADPAAVARAVVLRQLTNSPKSRLQLSRKLAERNIPEDVAEAVLDRFEEVRLIDDAEFADMWVRSRAQTRKLAKGALRRELAEKGIDQETAAGALEQLSDEDEEASARELVERKLRNARGLEDRAERDKAVRRLASMLARKGYQPSQAFRIVGEAVDASLEKPDGKA